jgi:NAD(P)-dependent dehydrogenase (short-subunit alcohol dehydrogenase family)
MSTSVDLLKGTHMADTWSPSQIPPLHGRVALVTGANAGLGLEIARGLARAGSDVVLACRNVDKANRAVEEIRASGGTGDLSVLQLDLADLGSVATAAETFRASGKPLHLLINNAGLMAIDQTTTVDGFEMQFGVNHLGHFTLTAELLPIVLATPGSRVVTMSSMGHRMGKMNFDDLMHTNYDRWRPYFQSKLANLLFTVELHRRLVLKGAETLALTAHPGASNTDLGTEGKGISNYAMKVVPHLTQSAARGSEPALRAATDPQARGGQFYGPRFVVQGPAVVETPSARARNVQDAKRLWTMSEELTHRTVLAG